jgi:hypothetical protein
VVEEWSREDLERLALAVVFAEKDGALFEAQVACSYTRATKAQRRAAANLKRIREILGDIK